MYKNVLLWDFFLYNSQHLISKFISYNKSIGFSSII